MSTSLADRIRTVKPFELFFDLVFVFGFTQVTAAMAKDVSLESFDLAPIRKERCL